MKHIESFSKLIFEYNTGPIPPPFCNKYKIVVSKDDTDNYQIDLGIIYYDREGLTEEEIVEEGFFLNDDYNWKGKFPDAWGLEIEKKLKNSNWRKKKSPREGGSEFKIKIFHDRQSEVLHPADSRVWEIFIHEIIQVIYEISKKEAPLKISFSSGSSAGEKLNIDYTFSFAERAVLIDSSQNGKKSLPRLPTGQAGRQAGMDWEEGQKLLKYIFSFDYLPENCFDKITKKQGSYISPGDGFWYELAANENAKEEAIDRIDRLIETLKGYG